MAISYCLLIKAKHGSVVVIIPQDCLQRVNAHKTPGCRFLLGDGCPEICDSGLLQAQEAKPGACMVVCWTDTGHSRGSGFIWAQHGLQDHQGHANM